MKTKQTCNGWAYMDDIVTGPTDIRVYSHNGPHKLSINRACTWTIAAEAQ